MPEPITWDWRERERFEEWKRETWSRCWQKFGPDGVTNAYEKILERERKRIDDRLLEDRFDASGIAITSEDKAAVMSGRVQSTTALSSVKAWLLANKRGKCDPRFLVLLGSVGVGKTVAAAWALWELSGTYCVPDQLRDLLHPARRRDESEPMPRTIAGNLFVLDDLGTETDPRFGAALFELVNGRMRDGCLTIITGNLTREQARQRYDKRVVDRLNHSGRVMEIGGASMRKASGGF